MAVFRRIKKKGYYGLRGILLGSRLVLGLYRTRKHEELILFNRRVFRVGLSRKYALRDSFNDVYRIHNFRELRRLAPGKRQRILFVVSDLEAVGGVETRLANQFAFLARHGWLPMLLTLVNRCGPLCGYPNFLLRFDAPGFDRQFLELVRLSRASVVQMEFKGNIHKGFYDIDFDALRRLVRTGCTVHGSGRVDQEFIDRFDYRFVTFRNTHGYRNIRYLANSMDETGPVWSFSGQKTALFISRMDKEKLPALVNFIRLCEWYGIEYHVAGSVSEEVQEALPVSLPESAFLGPVRTLDFLRENRDRYLFVAGVGQVPMEGGMMGYPSLVMTHLDDWELSTFLTKDTFMFLRRWNFVIRKCPVDPCLGNVSAFFEDVRVNALSRYNVHGLVAAACGNRTVLADYLSIVEGKDPVPEVDAS